MNRDTAGTWSRVGETALLSLIFLAPLAAHGRTWDPSALRTALFQAVAVTMGVAWLMKGLARGRWEAASGAGTTLAPLALLAAWSIGRFALAPFKSAALPELTLTAAGWIVFAVAQLEFGGARHAARLSFWTAAAAALAAAGAAARHFGFGPVLMTPEQSAAFAAAALPVALSLTLDPEAGPTRRVLSWSTSVALAAAVAWSGSAAGLFFFILSSSVFAAVAALVLRGPAARRAAAGALGCAALAAVGSLSAAAYVSAPFRAHVVTDRIGTGLLAWTLLAVSAYGLRSAWDLHRRGALAEAGYAAAFSSLFIAWALSAAAGFAPSSGPAAWLAWAAAGVAAGMAPLSRARGTVRTMPLPFGEDVRRLMQGPALMLGLGALVWPGLWLASDVNFNRAVAEARAGRSADALADAGRVWPGSGVYPSALYLRGRVLMDQGKPQEALDAYARLDGVAPDFLSLHARKAEVYALVGDWAAAARERQREADLKPADIANLTAWAEAARAAGDFAAARRAVERALAISPEDAAVQTQMAANALMERKLAEQDGARRRNGRKGLALKPKSR
ncbi:MAG: tetratricopeptide repeat protein [Elusimicrobiota bacterium]